MKKFLAFTFLLLATLVCAVVFSFNRLACNAVSKLGSHILGVPMVVSNMRVHWFGPDLFVEQVMVANPQGFSDGFALRLSELTIKVKMTSLLQNPIVVKSVDIITPEITYESNAKGNNLKVIREHAQAIPEKARTKDKASKPARRFVIEHLRINNAKLYWMPKQFPGRTITLQAPDLEVSDMGVSEKGLSPQLLAARILAALTANSAAAVAQAGTGTLREGVESLKKGLLRTFRKK